MKVWQLLDSPEKWCRGHLAVDRKGQLTDPESAAARRWCLFGAICRCYTSGRGKPRDRAYTIALRAEKLLGNFPLGGWNDSLERCWDDVYGVARALDI